MQDALRKLSDYWTSRGCLTWQPFNTEVGAGTMNAATVLRVLGPEPWDVAYVEPSVRPDDSRYGENPNRLQTHTQFQVILKPEPGDPQELYLGSLEALGIDLDAHDVRFVEDNWQQPAIGAWGLGWEVWLDGMEITQFTYFQQVGGQDLDPIPVELTYGMERILMAQQGVTHFKDIVYAIKPDGTPITYGETFGQNEYEMSRYYLDDADVEANQRLYETFVAEATRMVEARLPVPAHQYILKSSHAFNVLDARGAISTTERAQAFATMRRLMRDTAALWVERRKELGFPLLKDADAQEAPAAEASTDAVTEAPEIAADAAPQTFALEIGVEELPPHVLPQTVEAVREALTSGLAATRLEHGTITVDGTPRRVVAVVEGVAAREPDATQLRKGPKWAAAFDADGNLTKPLEGFMRGQGVTRDQVVKAEIGGNEHACVEIDVPGRDAVTVLGGIVESCVKGLRAEKNMRWSDPALSFSRAVRWLVALWGDVVVPAQISEVHAGRTTYLQRVTEASRGADGRSGRRADGAPVGHVEVTSADELLTAIERGEIEWRTADRRADVVRQATALAEAEGGRIDVDANADLLDEITNLVEQPHGILGRFDERYLELPDRILTSVMARHQRYLPVLDAQGDLMPCFVTMANGTCDDDVVRAGNESVIRARYEDALFFWNADLQAGTVDEFVPGLDTLTFENRLGSVGQRARRIAAVASALGDAVALDAQERETLTRAGQLAKFDLATQLVVEMSSLAGFVAREYALRKGEPEAVAQALYEMEQPHTAVDAVPASVSGALLALGDRFDLLMAMFALGAKPTGSSDPYGLRRAALGVVRILREAHAGGPLAPLSGVTVTDGLTAAAARLREQGITVSDDAVASAAEFTTGRLAQLLRDEGVGADLVATVLPAADRPGSLAQALADVTTLREGDRADELEALVEALVRIERIVPAGTAATYDAALLTEPAEVELRESLERLASHDDLPGYLAAVGDAGLVPAIARFFDDILVMAKEEDVKAARLGLLAAVRATAPTGIDYRALDTLLA
ncbi:glycine--tRNA ligase [Mobilicoccus pelagius]|uniref:Multifunctional fusion protein n=1 Tax=Mobilicoccus pelagius NBRC 104925 TaxID=1089455 RepID=H5UW15_9MICO|nr:glycine--tRNA ligase [Mobilicoccus pelagius]GAB49923.1 glycyl-tRNA synthetase [Mobilicoccus pelagius NBRC 104925]